MKSRDLRRDDDGVNGVNYNGGMGGGVIPLIGG